jgi:hypothetical protein
MIFVFAFHPSIRQPTPRKNRRFRGWRPDFAVAEEDFEFMRWKRERESGAAISASSPVDLASGQLIPSL